MNTKMRIVAALLGTSFAFGLLIEPTTSAQSARSFLGVRGNATPAAATNSDCKKIQGRSVQTFDPASGIVSGPVTNSGLLDGTIQDSINFLAGFVLTPDPNVVAYTTELTITTSHGQLKSSPVTTQSLLTGAGSEWGHINPSTSTGRFSGATGIVFLIFKPIGDPSVGPYETEITADICFAQ